MQISVSAYKRTWLDRFPFLITLAVTEWRHFIIWFMIGKSIRAPPSLAIFTRSIRN